MTVVFLAFSLLYFLLLMLAIGRWKSLMQKKPLPESENAGHLFLSVIIPARNEATNINALFEALSKQRFSPSHFEVILIDDHSEDNTVATAKAIGKALQLPLKIISLREEASINDAMEGKKKALQKGIEEAKGDIIITTDADCIMGENWLQSIHEYFVSKSTKMLVGPVTFHDTAGLFGSMQTIEFAALNGTGAVSLDFGKPNMCNGANLAFEKRAFEKVGGYKDNWHIPSGDDEFLLQKIHKLYPHQVLFNINPEGIVSTNPVKNIKDFVAQRKRWGGKWRLHESISVKLLALFIYFYHLVLVVSFFATMSTLLNPYVFVCLFLLKCLLEYFFLKSILHFLGKPFYFKHFVFLQIVYSIYVLTLGMLTNFGSFDWKGRKY